MTLVIFEAFVNLLTFRRWTGPLPWRGRQDSKAHVSREAAPDGPDVGTSLRSLVGVLLVSAPIFQMDSLPPKRRV